MFSECSEFRHDPCRVLIVDDDGYHRALEREILAAGHFEIVEAANGDEALAALIDSSFDAVLLDLRMPDMDGIEVCTRIRRDLEMSLLPIIIVTGTGDQNLEASLLAGATDFIRKPYNPLELLARIRSAVRQKRITDELDSVESLLFAVARMVEAKDEQIGDHCSRLAHTATVFGEALGLNKQDLRDLRRGAILHDIGKLAIPDKILQKRGPLTTAETALMEQHTVTGALLCSGLRSVSSVTPIIRHHHERWDGTGGPDGLKGEQIPLLARVFQIVDIHDALAHARPYKKAYPVDKIISTFEEETARGWRDPKLVAVFLDILRTRPDDLRLPEDARLDSGAGIFDELAATGVLEADPRPYCASP